jgi:hypothetical protein
MGSAGYLVVLVASLAALSQSPSEPSGAPSRGHKIEVRQFEVGYTRGKAGVEVRLTLAVHSRDVVQ